MEPNAIFRRWLIGFSCTVLGAAALAGASHFAELCALLRRTLHGLTGVALAVLLFTSAARANELAGVPGAADPGFVIHGAAETLRDYCATDGNGVTWLALPGGARYELVTSTSDPAIANPGDGAFHAYDVAEIQAALAAVRFPLQGVTAEIFVLPYPRRSGLESAAGPGLVLLSPGVRPLSPEHQHAEFTHELGHVVQYRRLPDRDVRGWESYRSLRGIGDATVYNAAAPHADRPHEIFAEDFRALFGDGLANTTGTIENPDLPPPAQVRGLAEFMRGLAEAPLAPALAATPNPARGPLTFSRPGAVAVPLDLFDAAGRRIVSLAPQRVPGGVQWSWDRRDARGARAGAGVVFARARDGGAPLRVTLLP
ncbi:MAG: hypothetical protein HZC42_12855 [Candidatus Eisenbacteria bacterium]|nr:hypothetical protein [Candidatus Eisenbacteria bacterium]